MRIEYKLEQEELVEIERAIRQDKRPEVRQRATVIRLLHLQYRPETIATQQMVSLPTIYNWHRLWREKGICGLVNQPRKGRPPKADDSYCEKLAEAIEKGPSEYGYRFATWTLDRLRQHIENETGILLSKSRFRALVKKKRYRYRNLKYGKGHFQEAKAKKIAEKLLEETKK